MRMPCAAQGETGSGAGGTALEQYKCINALKIATAAAGTAIVPTANGDKAGVRYPLR